MMDNVYKERRVRLIGQLVGQIWMPNTEARLDVDVDLTDRASRFVNADGSGLIDAVKSVVDGAGDFQSAALTADSFVTITHRTVKPGRRTENARIVDVVDLPSLADYVDAETFTVLS